MQYTLSQVWQLATTGFQELFGEFSFLCVAEVVKYNENRGNVYIECIEYDANNEVKAQCTVCVFNKSLMPDFFSATGLQSATLIGQKILFNGRFSMYKDRITIIADAIHPTYTLGQLQQSQKYIIETLTKEGVIHNNKQTTLGYPPYSLAIISSLQSDGLQDFFAILNQYNIPYSYTIYDTQVHSNTAKESVYKSLQSVYSDYKKGIEYNALCIIRGGGDMAGMVRQNDVDIARGICHMPIPVIVAIGHTKDATILDDVGYHIANTPTAAGQFLIDTIAGYSNHIDKLYETSNSIIQQKLSTYTHIIQALYEKVGILSNEIITRLRKNIHILYEIIAIYHPQNILEKGYSLVRQHDSLLGKDIPSIGEQIEIETAHFVINAYVDSVATKE